MPSEEGSLQLTSQTSTNEEREVRRKVWTDPKTGETSVYPYTAVESPPQSTPNNKESIELEQDTAAPWFTGKKTTEPSPSDLSVHSPREQLKEDEILQEVLEEEAVIARLTEAAKTKNQSQDPASDFDSLRRILRNNVEEDEFKEAERGRNDQGQGEEEEEEEEEEEHVEEKEQESGQFKRETTWKGIATEEEEVLEIDKGFVVAEKEVSLAANKVPEEKDRLFNWSSDDEEEIDVHRKSKEEMKAKVISTGKETAKAVAKLMKMIPKGLKERRR
ncbi:hypothetical protein KEM48_009881 [Puccinia striiformis f. sp. tritici PST-130]|nr:hypothetical protein KEM48_009881 [Puccinia striiformis f. sp. tritici PST-130]